MATLIWLDVDGNWANVNNWNKVGTGVGVAIPVDGDDVVINYGSKDITSGLNQSGVDLKSLNITSGYRGNIGTNGTSLQISVDYAGATAFRVAMGGQYIYWSGTSTVDINIGSTGTGGFYITGGDNTGHSVIGGQSGKIIIGSGVTLGDIKSAGAGFDCSSACSNAYLQGGNHVLRADVTNLYLGANVACTLDGSGVDFSNAYCQSGSRLVLNTDSTSLGTLNAYTGSYQSNGGKYDNTVSTLNQWVGSVQSFNTASAKTTVTTTNTTGVK